MDINRLTEEYFQNFNINQRAMAASTQSLKFCINFIENNNCNTVLDAGSGLSSIYFHSQFENVKTVDDNIYWADITKKFLKQKLNYSDNITQIDSIHDEKYDFVFYDYGNMESRIFHFKHALKLTKNYMYIDDMHVIYYREYIQNRTNQYKLIFLPQTIDEFGRFGALLLKDKNCDCIIQNFNPI